MNYSVFSASALLVCFAAGFACDAPSTAKVSSDGSAPASTTEGMPPKKDVATKPAKQEAAKEKAKKLPGVVDFKRQHAVFKTKSGGWTFTPSDMGYDVTAQGETKLAYRLVHRKRSFHLEPQGEKTKKVKPLVVKWQPLGVAISRQENAPPFLSLRLTSKGWQVHRPGKVVVGSYAGPLLRLDAGAATARADGRGQVHAKIAGQDEVTHVGHLEARVVVLTLLPDLSLVEASTVALFFAEERW